MNLKELLGIGLLFVATVVCSSCIKATPSMAPEEIGLIDLASVEDGVWIGSQDSVKVSVEVVNNRITKIDYVKPGWTSVGRKAQYIRNDIIKKQSLQVDCISGATITSKDILKAVENALSQGVK